MVNDQAPMTNGKRPDAGRGGLMNRTLMLSCCFLLLLGCGGGMVMWTATIDCGGTDDVGAALADNGMNIVALGTKTLVGTDRTAWLIQSLDRDGRPVWRQEYREGEQNTAGDVALSPAGESYCCGRVRLEGSDLCVVAKYRVDGSLAWQRALAVGEGSGGSGIALDGDELLVAGFARAEDRQELLVARLDRNGSTLWSRNYRFGTLAGGTRIAADGKGNAVVVGQAGSAENPDIVLAKLDGKGDTLWSRVYDSGGEDRVGDVAVDVFGNVVATGTALVEGEPVCVILEYHPDGELIRKTAYGEGVRAEGRAIAATGDGDLYIAATLHGEDVVSTLAFHYQPNAGTIWERTWRGSGETRAADLSCRDDVILLNTVETADGSHDMVVARLRRPQPAPAN
jgi:hypothetical protein